MEIIAGLILYFDEKLEKIAVSISKFRFKDNSK